MERFIPYEKLSKKKKRELDLRQRGTWGALNPVTRKPPKPGAYDRRKAQSWKKDSGFGPDLFLPSLQKPQKEDRLFLEDSAYREGGADRVPHFHR